MTFREKAIGCESCHGAGSRKSAAGEADFTIVNPAKLSRPDVQHVAFTHHRIGRHRPQPKDAPAGVPDLVPLDGNPHLTALDPQRNLGLAYMEVYRNPAFPQYADTYRERARANLGPRPLLACATRRRCSPSPRSRFSNAIFFAPPVIRAKPSPPRTSSRTRGRRPFKSWRRARETGNLPAATALLEQNVKRRQFADDWRLIGANYLDGNNVEGWAARIRRNRAGRG